MSAFIVEDRTINKILAFLAQNPPRGIHSEPGRPFWALGYDLKAEDEAVRHTHCERLAADLFAMNCTAVEARYGQHEDVDLPFLLQNAEPPSPLEFIQRCSCLGYQCCEGDVPNFPLYKALREAQDITAMAYIMSLPAWDELNCWE
jgi:hypothetical protein